MQLTETAKMKKAETQCMIIASAEQFSIFALRTLTVFYDNLGLPEWVLGDICPEAYQRRYEQAGPWAAILREAG